MSGPDPGAALFAALPGEQREALRRCSVMALFDKDAYAAALRLDTGPELDALVEARLVEHLSGGDDKYRVQPLLQDVAWASWFPHGWPASQVPAPLRAVAREVVDWCRANGEDVERLRALLLVDRPRAARFFRRAFAVCDERSDLAGCSNLLEVLSEPARCPLVDSALAADRDDRARYLAARLMWRSAYYGSEPARYLARADLEARLASVLDRGPWLLRLSGSGGNGKSTLLRWLLARQCVPRRVPCALIDLDRPLDPINATRHPWLLLVEFAHQLNEQMAGRPFRPLLRDYGFYRHVLFPDTSTQGRAAAAALDTPTGGVDATEIVSIFIGALRDAGSPAPIVVVDTVEEAALRPAGGAGQLLALLGTLRSETGLRVIVVGRGTTADAGLTPDEEVAVNPFTEEQSRTYLTTVRRMTDPALVGGIVDRARGVPWQLALWGDVVAANPTLTWPQLERAEPEAAWVVDRIVGRIENVALQWLVRYGVVPRRLRREFAEQVLIPRIRTAVRGSDDDRPEQDARPQGGDAVPVFDTDVDLPSDSDAFARLWEQLTRYASRMSWLWLADGDAGTIVFQPELCEPVRALLAAQPIGVKLHRDAVAYYSRLAAEDSDRWVSWTCEAIYHRFCAGDPDAGRYWREALARARQAGLGGETIVQLAGELLGPDYVVDSGDAETPPRALAGKPVIDRRTRGAARAELAWAQCRIARRNRLPGGHATWSTVESNLAEIGDLELDADADVRRRSAAAALDLARDRPDRAAAVLAELATIDGPPSVDRCIVLLLLAAAQGAVPAQRWAARETLEKAAEVADGLGVGEVSARIAVAVADRAVQLGRLDEAADGLRRTVAKHPQLADDPELRRTRARCALDLGRPTAALAAAPTSEPVRAEALLALGDAEGATRVCSDLLAGLVDPARRAPVLVARAQAHSRLLLVDQAVDDLAAAREVYGQLGDIEGAGWCTALAAEVMLRDVGSLIGAGQYLDESARLPLEPGSPAWARCRLLAAELAAGHGDRVAADRAASEALDVVIGRCGDPRLAVQVALAAFCSSPGLDRKVRGVLRTNLPLITPETARLTALTALPRCPRWSWGRQLLKLAFPLGRAWTVDDAPDRPWLQLRAADLMRVAGRVDDAVELITVAVDALDGSTPLAGWIWLQAVRRPELPAVAEHPAASRIPDDSASPLLAAAQRITLAERRLGVGDRAGAVAQLLPAEQALAAATARATDWKHRLHGLREALTEVVDESGGGHSRESLLREATRRELGYAARTSEVEESEPPPATGTEHTVTAAIDGAARLVLSRGARGNALAPMDPLVVALREQTRSTGRSSVVSWVRAQLDRRQGLLALDEFVPAADQEVTLLATDPLLAQLPWELATVAGTPLAGRPVGRTVLRAADPSTAARTRVRMLQEALATAGVSPGPLDGLHGPETAAALRAFQERARVAPDGAAGELTWAALRRARRPGPPRVLVLPAGLPGSDLVQRYRRCGWEATAAHGVGAAMEEPDTSGPVDVLHLVATMHVTGAVPVIGLGFDADPLHQETMSCLQLDALLRRLALRGSTPLVVLDVAAQPHLGEAVRQLLLRNDFAQQVLGLGQSYAALATGPTRVHDGRRLVTAVAAAPTATDLARRLQMDHPEPGEVLPRAATALFTALLAGRMPALGRIGRRHTRP